MLLYFENQNNNKNNNTVLYIILAVSEDMNSYRSVIELVQYNDTRLVISSRQVHSSRETNTTSESIS